MYVALDPAIEPAVVALKTAAAEPAVLATGEARLVESRWRLQGFKRETCGFRVIAEGYGQGEMVWTTAPGQTFDVFATRSTRLAWKTMIAADGNGRLAVTIDTSALEPLELRFLCHER